MFWVSLPTLSVIYSEKYAHYLGKFYHAFEVFQGLFFAFLLKQKEALETRLKTSWTRNKWENRNSRTRGKTEFYEFDLSNSNGLKKYCLESDIFDVVINSISSDLPLRSYLEGNLDMNIASMSQILQSHVKEPNSTTLFTALRLQGKQ